MKKQRHTSDQQGIANTRYLTRILTYLGEVEYSNYTDLHEALGLESRRVRDALNWLIAHKLIDKKYINRIHNNCVMYSMNKKYFDLWYSK